MNQRQLFTNLVEAEVDVRGVVSHTSLLNGARERRGATEVRLQEDTP